MRVAVIGGGLAGLTTALLLRRQYDHDVIVLERDHAPGLGASFANGTLITPSMSAPWNTPGCWRLLLKSVFLRNQPLQLRLAALPTLPAWGLRFLRNSRPAAHRRHLLSNLRLSLYSLETMRALRRGMGMQYGQAENGTLRLFRSAAAFDAAASHAIELERYGISAKCLAVADAVDLEPALAPIGEALVGAIHYPGDESGDARLFCDLVARLSVAEGVDIRFGAAVRSFGRSSRKIRFARLEDETIEADHFIVAAGSYSAPLVRSLGATLPVRPAKGYSLTFPLAQGQAGLRIPIVDDDFHAVVAPLPGALRVAGTAEFAGFDTSLDPKQIAKLMLPLRVVLPAQGFDLENAVPWCGLRAMSCDGVPLIGRTAIQNLWLNTGHGHLGWTMAAGSARLLCDLLAGAMPEIDPAPYSPMRFEGPARHTAIEARR